MYEAISLYFKQYNNVHNVYFFNWECDALVINKSEYLIECEVKISRADFKKDFAKVEKHLRLQDKGCFDKPNRFYYVCPENLIKVEEIPSYAGLFYVKYGTLEKIKEAPLLHKNKLPYKEKLFNKLYFAYKELQQFKSEDTYKEIKRELFNLKKTLANKELVEKESDRYIRELTSELRHLKYGQRP